MSRPTVSGRYVVVAGLTLTGLAMVVSVLAVGSVDRPSTTARLIDGLHRQLLVVAIPIAVLVEAVLVYAVWRFHDNDDPEPTPENRRLELTWTVATGVVLLYVAVATYLVLAQPAVTATAATAPTESGPTADTVSVNVTAQQWHWSVTYPEANVTQRHPNRIVLPANRPLRISVTSTDVIHSFHAPELGLKRDAFPGRWLALETTVTRTGEYRLYCAEYCGLGHSRMETTIEVVPPAEYRDWLNARQNASRRR